MRVLLSTTGTGIGRSDEERKKTLEGMVDALIKKVIDVFRPDKLVLFYTEGTKEMVELIKSKTNMEIEEVKLENPDDFNSCFETMFYTMKKYAHKELLVNYTFGTKTMSSAMASCGVLFDAKLVLIGGERRGGIVVSGLEKVLYMEPYRLKDKIILERVMYFFNNYNFSASISEANDLKAYEHKKDLIDFILAYREWDLFRHESAFEKLKSSWKSIDFVDVEQVKKNLEFLGRLTSKLKTDDVDTRKMILLDLMENARRRIEIGYYDDAVARLYRAAELVSQILLKVEGYDDPIVLSKDELSKKYEPYAEKIGEKVKLRLGLVKKLEFLSDLGVRFADEMLNDEKLWSLINMRNNSILAHGLKAVKEDKARDFYERVLFYVRELCENKYDDLEKCRFPKMDWRFSK